MWCKWYYLMGWPTTIESCSWIDFIYVAYASWYHWICGRTQRKAATINQLACPSYSFYVQKIWYPKYNPGGMKARVGPVQWSKPHSILAPTQDSNPDGRIKNHKRWPLHYHCTQYGFGGPKHRSRSSLFLHLPQFDLKRINWWSSGWPPHFKSNRVFPNECWQLLGWQLSDSLEAWVY